MLKIYSRGMKIRLEIKLAQTACLYINEVQPVIIKALRGNHMKYNKRNLIFYAVAALLIVPLFMGGIPAAQAQEGLEPLIIASPGESYQYPFYIDDIFDLKEFSPLAFTFIVAYGQDPSAPGTITLTLDPTKSISDDFLFKMSYMMVGFSYAQDGTPKLILVSKNSPLKIVKKIDVNSTFGIVGIGIIVTAVDNPGSFTFPAKFLLTVDVTKATPKPAADEE